MAIESKNLLVAVKAFARGNALPLDSTEIWESLAEAEAYAAGVANTSTTAYVGQTLKVIDTTKQSVTVYIIADNAGTLLPLIDNNTVPEVESIPRASIEALFNKS